MIKIKDLSLFVPFLLVLLVINGCRPTSSFTSTHDKYTIDSKILAEKRELFVRRPRGYTTNSKERYPVVYVFGGNSLSYSIFKDLDLLIRTGHCKPAIIVGVPNISQKTRQRDLTPPFLKQDLDESDSPLGRADHYLEFIEKEIIPLINSNYKTSSKRIAVGHSREGLMVMYTLIAKPNLFSGHLAMSPALWREGNRFTHEFRDFIKEKDTIATKLFLSLGGLEVKKMKDAFDLTVNILEQEPSKTTFQSLYFPGANHADNPFLTAPIGLEWILNN